MKKCKREKQLMRQSDTAKKVSPRMARSSSWRLYNHRLIHKCNKKFNAQESR